MKTTVHQFIIESGWDYGCVEDTAEWGVSDFDACLMSFADGRKLLAYCRARVANAANADILGLAEIVIFEDVPGSEHDDELRAEDGYRETFGQEQDRERNR